MVLVTFYAFYDGIKEFLKKWSVLSDLAEDWLDTTVKILSHVPLSSLFAFHIRMFKNIIGKCYKE